ncbi:unnamed protein product [Arabidopsis thaliana]|uniref:Uncharacterized protein n=1 Tax=Arabidopsis thaliana TaxID=3702 RepID=A0A654E5H6_ARATH|nr:unnamed protein product [Arabidopsis thaliana]VYS44501.1 unnamed protein product [Arabidopsis thaliana]VYS44540.1 unnamed protein product [Arabidopsis thaliana]VYS44549.1 unnamed protein product [Arabidopsis thaliana]VYS44552.1 unnamed protein product [Arabidopsis thaliana]
MLGVTLTKVHSEKSKSRDRLVQKETKENAWGDRRLEIVEGKKSVPRNRRSGLGIVEKSLPGPRICRPGVEIVEKNLSGPRNRRPGRGIVDRVRGFVDQGLKSSTRSETSSTGSEDLSTRSGNRREKSIGSEESSTRTRNRRLGFVDQGLKSSTRSETSSTGSEDSSTRSETSSTVSKYLIFFWNRCLLRHFNVCWCQEGKGL